jgi:octaprenyl-diphosphate synthase
MNTAYPDDNAADLACEKIHKVGQPSETSILDKVASLPSSLVFPFALVAPGLVRAEEEIRAQGTAFDPGVAPYVDYVLATSGKRIRPALALLVGGALGGPEEDVVKLGVILEMIHLATLVHDDIMDGAAMRRSMATASAKWGNALSVLLGDCLFARALELAASYESTHISRCIAKSSNEVCMGEILQTQRRFDFNLTLAEYFKIIRMKTAALFSSATELAAYLSGADEATQVALRNYGDALGTAYQIYDDLLDLAGSEEKIGKTLGTDLVKGKLTLPVLYLRDAASEPQKLKLQKLLLAQQPIDGAVLKEIADYNGAFDKAINTAFDYLKEADDALACLPKGDHREALHAIVDYLGGLLTKLRTA